jgi:hypothetical protein
MMCSEGQSLGRDDTNMIEKNVYSPAVKCRGVYQLKFQHHSRSCRTLEKTKRLQQCGLKYKKGYVNNANLLFTVEYVERHHNR